MTDCARVNYQIINWSYLKGFFLIHKQMLHYKFCWNEGLHTHQHCTKNEEILNGKRHSLYSVRHTETEKHTHIHTNIQSTHKCLSGTSILLSSFWNFVKGSQPSILKNYLMMFLLHDVWKKNSHWNFGKLFEVGLKLAGGLCLRYLKDDKFQLIPYHRFLIG